MATSKGQRSMTIDDGHYEWYKRLAASDPLTTMIGLRRMAHDVFQDNYGLMGRVQRPLQDAGIYMSNSELVGKLLRMVVYGKIDLRDVVTVVSEESYCSAELTLAR